jgi:hypothetical protein
LQENASRLKNIKLNDKHILLLFEVWSKESYQYTAYMIVANDGKIVVDTTDVGFPMRIHRTDNPIKKGNEIMIICGEANNKVAKYSIEF